MLATIGIVDCIFRCVASARPVSIVGHGERPFRFRLNGTERNGNVTVLLTPTVYCSACNFCCEQAMTLSKVPLKRAQKVPSSSTKITKKGSLY